ncbi:MAG: magnesium transporter MgtE N-terminal domain-containing protein [Propionibacteriaceae bacterium]
MSSASTSIFISRLQGLPVLDGGGDQIGKVRDVVVQLRTAGRAPRAKGLVVELFAKHRVFLPMPRVTNIDPGQVYVSGVVNTRRFARREAETLVIEDLFDRQVRRVDDSSAALIFDVAMRPIRNHDWELSEVALRDPGTVRRFGRRGHVTIVEWAMVTGFRVAKGQGTDQLVARMEDMKPADVARELHDLSPERRREVAAALDDEKLADAIEELPDEEQVELISGLELERAAVVLGEMDPDDAADLISGLDPTFAEELLSLMDSEDARGVRRLMSYEDLTAGGMMTPEPVVLAHDGTVADALARVRPAGLTPALACMVYVCRSPLETPTGRYLGGVHIQRLLREPPSTLVSALMDSDFEPLSVGAGINEVARYFATYNMVNAPVVDDHGRLIGAVTVDDLLDHMLPEDWRGAQLDSLNSTPEETPPESSEPELRDEVRHGQE